MLLRNSFEKIRFITAIISHIHPKNLAHQRMKLNMPVRKDGMLLVEINCVIIRYAPETRSNINAEIKAVLAVRSFVSGI